MLCWITLLHWDSKQDQAVSTLSLLCFCEMQSVQRELGWRSPASPQSLPCRDEMSPISILWSSGTTIKATNVTRQVWFPRLLLGNARSSPPPPLPAPHQRDGIDEGLLDGVTCGWSHHRNGDSGLIRTLSCSPAAWREHRSCYRHSHSRSTLPVLQNRVKRYRHTRGRIFVAHNFLNCSSNMWSLNQKPCNEHAMNLLCVLLDIPTELFPCTCTRRKTWYPDFTILMCAKSPLISPKALEHYVRSLDMIQDVDNSITSMIESPTNWWTMDLIHYWFINFQLA